MSKNSVASWSLGSLLIVVFAFALPASAGAQVRRQSVAPGAPILFQPAVVYASGGQYAPAVAVADVNGDGKPDLLVANDCASSTDCTNGSVGVLLGNGDGTFKTAVSYNSGGYDATALAVADVNGDGKLDLVVAECANSTDCTGTVAILLGNGDGTFKPAVTYTTGGYYASSVIVDDVNRDGKPDLLVANQCISTDDCTNGTVGVLLGGSGGTFHAAKSYGSGGYTAEAIAEGDVNGDNIPDVLVANQCLSDIDCASGALGVLLGNGDGTFQTAASYGSGGEYASSVAVADLNGDGKPDLLAANRCSTSGCAGDGTIAILLNKGDGTFRGAAVYDSGGYTAVSVAAADVNGDGKVDVVVANNCISIGHCSNGIVAYLLNVNGNLQAATPLNSGGYTANFVVVQDVNGDGKPDLVVTNDCANMNNCANGTVGVLLGTQQVTSLTVTTSGSPSFINQPVTFTATITSGGGQIPNGETVTFDDDDSQIGTGTTKNGVAKFTTSSLPVGTQSIKAIYGGDSYFKGSSNAVQQVVQLYPTTTTLASNPNPSFYGQTVVLTATVKSSAPGGATGNVTFKKGSQVLGTVNLSSGKATMSVANFAAGQIALTAVYNGDSQSAKSSGADTQTVKMAATTTTLTSSVNPSTKGQLVKFTATVSSSTTMPTGSVTFKDGSTVLGTTYLSNGSTTYGTTSLGVGSHNITAVYNGTANIAGSTSKVLVQVVNQ